MKNAIAGIVMMLGILSVGISNLPGEESGGYRLPGGDPDEGKTAFERLSCNRCHQVKGVVLAKPKGKRLLTLSLGEEIRFVKRYEDILTAISNPQHVVTKQYAAMLNQAEIDGEITAYMPDLTNDMSVRQLMDVAAFLDKVYGNLEEYKSTRGASQ